MTSDKNDYIPRALRWLCQMVASKTYFDWWIIRTFLSKCNSDAAIWHNGSVKKRVFYSAIWHDKRCTRELSGILSDGRGRFWPVPNRLQLFKEYLEIKNMIFIHLMLIRIVYWAVKFYISKDGMKPACSETKFQEAEANNYHNGNIIVNSNLTLWWSVNSY